MNEKFRQETIKDSVFSLHAQVSPHDPLERVLELLVGGRVAERVDGAVEIAHEVGEHVDVNVDAGRAEAGDDGQDDHDGRDCHGDHNDHDDHKLYTNINRTAINK